MLKMLKDFKDFKVVNKAVELCWWNVEKNVES